jgi:hypothetical protein
MKESCSDVPGDKRSALELEIVGNFLHGDERIFHQTSSACSFREHKAELKVQIMEFAAFLLFRRKVPLKYMFLEVTPFYM